MRPGIGSAVVKAFVTSGCTRIVITDLNETTLSQTRDALLSISPDIDVLAVAGDITEEDIVKSLTEKAVKHFGRIDYAVNCAGVNAPSLRSHETPLSLFDHVNNANYRGCWLSSRAWISQMLTQEPLAEHPKQRGAIVSIASQLGSIARPNASKSHPHTFTNPAFPILPYQPQPSPTAPYCASKAAVINMTHSDAIDYFREAIRINCVCPGIIEMPMAAKTEDSGACYAVGTYCADEQNRPSGRGRGLCVVFVFLCSEFCAGTCNGSGRRV
jgi:NAD(P)-dependent dehydrogenase (short-subunit alcohol dehydrogenase family)